MGVGEEGRTEIGDAPLELRLRYKIPRVSLSSVLFELCVVSNEIECLDWCCVCAKLRGLLIGRTEKTKTAGHGWRFVCESR